MGGCFSSRSTVQREGGTRVPMSRLAVGDRVLSVDPSSGVFRYAPVVGFLHRSPNETATVWDVETEDGQTVTLTPDHLIFAGSEEETGSSAQFADSTASFAATLRPNGSFVFVRRKGEEEEEEGTDGVDDDDRFPVPSKVVRVTLGRSVGLFAPLTGTGTIVVDDVVASCYALVDSHVTAHHVVAPLRLRYHVGEALSRYYFRWTTMFTATTSDPDAVTPGDPADEGIHWYARFMYAIGSRIAPSYFFRVSNELSMEENGHCQQCLPSESL